MAHERAGQLAQPSDLVDIVELVTAYYTRHPDPNNPDQKAVFDTSGYRGSSLDDAFDEDHIYATTRAIVDYRKSQGTEGSLYMGRDTHGLSEPVMISVLEVFTASDIAVMADAQDHYTPTPTVSHAILTYNRDVEEGPTGSSSTRADGIVITPSHNPPRDSGFEYNPPTGGPADTDTTNWIAARANKYLTKGLDGVKRQLVGKAGDLVVKHNYLNAYVSDLPNVVNFDAIRDAGMCVGADPMGDASVDYWGAAGDAHSPDLTVVNSLVNATWRFMTLDTDGKIRMDCSLPNAMASLIGNCGRLDISTGNDADSDRHGVVTPDAGLMDPDHYLAVTIGYLFAHRPSWSQEAAIGKTLVSSSMIDRVVANLDHKLVEIPVGFKWFVPGLFDGTTGFGGEESTGASFLRHDNTVWSTDKDDIILDLLVNEIRAVTKKTPSQPYAELADKYGAPAYAHTDTDATREQKTILKKLSPEQVKADTLAGETTTAKLAEAPDSGAAIGDLRVVTKNAWFAARPSGTEDEYKVHAEFFRGTDHLAQVQAEAQDVISTALNG